MKNSAIALSLILSVFLAGAEDRYAFRDRMAELHPNRLAEDALPLAADEIVIDSGWGLRAASDAEEVVHAVADLRDFLAKSMRVTAGERGEKSIVVAVDPSLAKLQSKVSVSDAGIRVTGVTPREALQGCYRLEDLMGARGRPALKKGERTFTRAFSPRMTHSGWEVEKFPDVYMDQLAHAGMDAILVFIADPPDVTRNGREDMNELVARAKRHGLDVYAYCWFPEKSARFNPLDPKAEAWYDKTYGAIVKNAPGVRGLICVGESVGFPVRDGTSAGYWWGRPEERVKGKPLNGFAPTLEWVPWLNLVSKVTRKYKPDVEILFWTYNWFRQPEKDRLALLEAIPTNVTLHVTFEMGDKPHKVCGVDTIVWDYSISRPGPGTVFASEAAVAKRRGIALTSMSNTGGRTWDIGCAPYHPVPDRWLERFENLREARETWGLSGLMECHHYGFQPNFIAELAKEAFTVEADVRMMDGRLRAIAARDFGTKNVETVLAAWKDWSEAFRYHSAHHCDLAGPWRTGPAYPFVLPGGRRPLPNEPKWEIHDGVLYGDGWRYLESEYEMPVELLDSYIEMSRREIALMEKGCARLRAALADVPDGKRPFAERMLANGDFHLASARTLLNARIFRKLGFDPKGNLKELLSVLDDEEKNVRFAIPAVELDSSLGWEPTMLYVCDRKALEWKLNQLNEARREVRIAALEVRSKEGCAR